MLDLSRAGGTGDTGFRNAVAKQAAARAVKRRKAVAPAQVIDLSDDTSDDQAPNLQNNTQDIIDLIDSDSPAVNLHGHRRLASSPAFSAHSSQPHLSSSHVTQCISRNEPSYPDNMSHHKHGSLSTLPGSSSSMPSTHSSRKRTASSLDTVSLDQVNASNLDQPTSSVPTRTLSRISSSSMLHSSRLNTGQGASDSVQKRMAAVKQHEGRRGFSSPDPRERPIDLVRSCTVRPGVQKGGSGSEAGGGHIDLVKVTENYSGALQAASRRVQHASTDPALTRALAEKAELERQLKEALANKQACHPNQPLRAPMPSHWTDMPQDASVEYVELPLPPGCSPAYCPPADQYALPPLDEGVLKAMMYQLPKADAEAALRHCHGDGDAALLYAVHCHSHGGAAAVAQRGLAAASTSSRDFAQAAAEQARKEADLQEAQSVLARVTANNSTIQLSHVVRIERVQNPHLWTKYCLRRHEVELAAGAGNVNEQLLFHGCSKDTLAIIGAEGFDIRVSGMSCSLGAGTYFAGNSSYSVSYVDKGPGMTAVPGAGMPVPWGGFGFAAGMPGWPPGALMPAFSQAPGSRASNILPHPSMRGILKSPKKGSAPAKGNQPKKDPSKPHFTQDTKAMFLCRVALGRLAVGQPGMRLPPKGSDSVSSNGRTSIQTLGQSIFAVFDNSQAYPEFVIHFRQQ